LTWTWQFFSFRNMLPFILLLALFPFSYAEYRVGYYGMAKSGEKYIYFSVVWCRDNLEPVCEEGWIRHNATTGDVLCLQLSDLTTRVSYSKGCWGSNPWLILKAKAEMQCKMKNAVLVQIWDKFSTHSLISTIQGAAKSKTKRWDKQKVTVFTSIIISFMFSFATLKCVWSSGIYNKQDEKWSFTGADEGFSGYTLFEHPAFGDFRNEFAPLDKATCYNGKKACEDKWGLHNAFGLTRAITFSFAEAAMATFASFNVHPAALIVGGKLPYPQRIVGRKIILPFAANLQK